MTNIAQRTEKPAWLDGFLSHYLSPKTPSIAEALESYACALPDGVPAPSYRQVRTALEKLASEMGGRS